MSHRRRALVLGGLALVLGGLAAFNVAGREAALERRVGGLVDVVVARRAIPAGRRLSTEALAIRRVPARFAPRGTTGDPRGLAGQRARVPIAAGTDLTAELLGDEDERPAGPPIGRGERVVEVVALGPPGLVTAGSRVDVLVSPEPRGDGPSSAILALEDVEVLAATVAGTGAGEDAAAERASGQRVAASLRVTLRQAVYLAAAQDFARELRLLPRASGDRSRGLIGLRRAPEVP